MDQDLQRLVRELRKERCPQRVLDRVAQRVCAQPRPRSRLGYKIAAVAAALALLCGLAVWRRPMVGEAWRYHEPARRASLARARVAEEARGALGYVGCFLLDASARSEKIVLNEAVPPLRNSFATARNKILNHMEP